MTFAEACSRLAGERLDLRKDRVRRSMCAVLNRGKARRLRPRERHTHPG
jgi:hypothetical protein